jgi:hypothetical protein
MLGAGIDFHEVNERIRTVIRMQEFAPRGAGSPDFHGPGSVDLRLVRLADQGRYDV